LPNFDPYEVGYRWNKMSIYEMIDTLKYIELIENEAKN
jgi:hypothetical protein